MHVVIRPDKPISDVQQDFTAAFPYLKLEFLGKDRFAANEPLGKKILPVHSAANGILHNPKMNPILIPEEMKVNELEALFLEQFSRVIQVLRKSGNMWLATSLTFNWTLSQQNTLGKEISHALLSAPTKSTAGYTGNSLA